MANNLSLCLIAVMDRLWFQQIILFPENKLEPKQPYLEATANTTTTTSSTLSSPSLSSAADQQEPAPEEQVKKRSRRGNHSRSHSSSSSSPPAQKRDKRMNNQCKLRKSTSFRSLKDLELEEVKGFMDLGFVFTKEHLNPTMIRVVPGLLRLEFPRTKRMESTEVDGIDQEKKRVVIRPYLSEAWLIKRPDSPLLNLRVPRVSAAADMKKHLKFWARTVASVVQQES